MGYAPNKCPVCNSRNWIKIDSDTKGVSAGKAVVGGVLLGPIGLAAGLLGKKYSTYYCKDCAFKQEYKD